MDMVEINNPLSINTNYLFFYDLVTFEFIHKDKADYCNNLTQNSFRFFINDSFIYIFCGSNLYLCDNPINNINLTF